MDYAHIAHYMASMYYTVAEKLGYGSYVLTEPYGTWYFRYATNESQTLPWHSQPRHKN
jgi:hypothetical protein